MPSGLYILIRFDRRRSKSFSIVYFNPVFTLAETIVRLLVRIAKILIKTFFLTQFSRATLLSYNIFFSLDNAYRQLQLIKPLESPFTQSATRIYDKSNLKKFLRDRIKCKNFASPELFSFDRPTYLTKCNRIFPRFV